MIKRLALTALFGAALLTGGATSAFASSHREAPLISQDPEADLTDVYGWVDRGAHSKVNLIVNAVPFELPSGAPNYYQFGTNVAYDINTDRNGDGKPDVPFRFPVTRHIRKYGTLLC